MVAGSVKENFESGQTVLVASTTLQCMGFGVTQTWDSDFSFYFLLVT